MPHRTRLSYQAALMAMSVWVLGSLLLGWSFAVVGLGGIVVLLVTLVGVRFGLRALLPSEDDEPEV